MVYFLQCAWEFTKKGIERREIYTFTIISFFYLSSLKIGIKSIPYHHFIKGMSVLLTFGKNAQEGWNELSPNCSFARNSINKRIYGIFHDNYFQSIVLDSFPAPKQAANGILVFINDEMLLYMCVVILISHCLYSLVDSRTAMSVFWSVGLHPDASVAAVLCMLFTQVTLEQAPHLLFGVRI